MKNKQDMLKVLNDTAAHFNLGNRSVVKVGGLERCKYFSKDNCGCAIGRLIPDKEARKDLDRYADSSVYRLYPRLPIELQEYPKEFLSELQTLHDIKKYWDEAGINQEGRKQVENIKKQFQLTEN